MRFLTDIKQYIYIFRIDIIYFYDISNKKRKKFIKLKFPQEKV